MREFAPANERHLDSSALGRWIPRPEPRRAKPRCAERQGRHLDLGAPKTSLAPSSLNSVEKVRVCVMVTPETQWVLLAWGALGANLGASGRLWGGFGNLWGCFGRLWGSFGTLWGSFVSLWGSFGRIWGGFGRLWGRFGKLWRRFGNALARLWGGTEDAFGNFGVLREPFFSSRLLFLPYIYKKINSRSTALAAPY